MPAPRAPKAGGFADDLSAKHIQTLSGGNRAPAPLADELDPELELVPENGSGPDYSVDGGEEVAEVAMVGGDDATAQDTSFPPPLPPAMPLAQIGDANALAAQVVAGLKAAGAPVTDGIVEASIQGMMRNEAMGIIRGATVDEAVGTAVRLNMRHQAAEAGAKSMEAATRASIMAEPRVPWRHEKRFKVTINGWVMIVPSNRLVQVPMSVYEVLQHAVAAEVIVKSMQLEMYNRMTGIPAPTEDPNMYEGYDDQHMRISI